MYSISDDVVPLKLQLFTDRICEWRSRGKETVRLRWLCFAKLTENKKK
jgi:hypothetical protein